MADNRIDLVHLFGQVAKTLAQNKAPLNKADTYNKNHGDNMVEIFKVIAQAVEEKRSASAADQLEYAASLLRQKESGSAQVYSQGLFQAAKDFKGKAVTTANALQLVQDLLGGGQPASTAQSGDAISSLLKGVMGGEQAGGNESLDASDLLNAGLAFMSAKQKGDSNVDALVKAVVSNSAMSSSPHRAQSGELVMDTLLNVIGSMAQRK
jgi:hypothetical protein